MEIFLNRNIWVFDMKVLMTGGAGFIGSHTADILAENGYEIAIIDNLSNGKRENINPAAKFYDSDITKDDIAAIFGRERPDFVIHMAAQISLRKSFENPEEDAKQNILGTMKVLEASASHGVKKIIYSSTAAVYGEPAKIPVDESCLPNPNSPYGLDKYAAEKCIEIFHKLRGIDYSILRYSNVYGPRQDPMGEAGVISIFIGNLLKGKSPEIFGDGSHTRDFVYVKDVAKANLAALVSGRNGIYNVGSGKEISVKMIFDIIKKYSCSDIEPIHGPPVKEVERMKFECSKIRKEMGWSPTTSIEDGIRETLDYFRNNP